MTRQRQYALISIVLALVGALVVTYNLSQVSAGALYGPKPNETGIPTPPPTIVVAMTPVPTQSVPDEKPTIPPQLVQPPAEPQPDDPYVLTISGTRINDHTVRLQDTSIVAIGTVRQIQSPRWTTADGKRPVNPHARNNAASIHRPMVFEVEEYLRGQQPQRTLLISLFGGSVGRDSVTFSMDDRYEFQEGQRYLVYLSPLARGKGQSPVDGPKWDLVDRYILTSDGQATNVLESVPLEQLREEIRRAGSQ